MLETSRMRSIMRAQIAEAMGINAVSYGLDRWKGILASTCKLFTDIDTSYVSMGRLFRNVTLKKCMDFCSERERLPNS